MTENFVKWKLQRGTLKTRYVFKNKRIKKFVNTPIACKITRPFILALKNHDIDNSFPKKNRKYWYIDFTLPNVLDLKILVE